MSKIYIRKVSITETGASCVVNAANEYLKKGSGVCGAIFKACGNSVALQNECDSYHGCETGSAVITRGYSLSPYIIHAVGPIYRDGKHHEARLLYSAYKKSLLLAMAYKIHDIAFPLISAGIYGYPLYEAWEIGLKACDDFIVENPEYEMAITFAVINDDNINVGIEVAEKLNIK